jgi:cytochrome c553
MSVGAFERENETMKIWPRFLSILLPLLGVLAIATPQVQPDLPAWAYVMHPPDYQDPVDDGSLRHVPDSTKAWTLTQLRDFFFAPDWHPGDHQALPEIVARGRKPDVYACGFCHRSDGPGGPENASLAGLPESYIAQQMTDFKSGRRRSAMPERTPGVLMAKVAKAASASEVKSAAAYFANSKPRRTITVVESDIVPKTHVAGWVLAPVNQTDKEPLGHRIIEMPKDIEQFESRDARSEFIAYAPVGSVKKGESLAKSGENGKTTQCALCHGADLRGFGQVPGIAGRSPSYVARQLYDFQRGQRVGFAAAPMTAVVSKLDADDVISLAAYLASLTP